VTRLLTAPLLQRCCFYIVSYFLLFLLFSIIFASVLLIWHHRLMLFVHEGWRRMFVVYFFIDALLYLKEFIPTSCWHMLYTVVHKNMPLLFCETLANFNNFWRTTSGKNLMQMTVVLATLL